MLTAKSAKSHRRVEFIGHEHIDHYSKGQAISECYRKIASLAIIRAGRDYYTAMIKGQEWKMQQILRDLPLSPIWALMEELNVTIDDFRKAAENGCFTYTTKGY